jgi:hypothetical protein
MGTVIVTLYFILRDEIVLPPYQLIGLLNRTPNLGRPVQVMGHSHLLLNRAQVLDQDQYLG